MIMEVTQVSPFLSSSQEEPRQTYYYRPARKPSISFGAMLADEEEKLADTALPRADEFTAIHRQTEESHYALSEKELEESLQKLLHYAGLDGLE